MVPEMGACSTLLRAEPGAVLHEMLRKSMRRALCAGMGAAVPGDLVRFQVVFWLTSSTKSTYLHVSTVKVRFSRRAPSLAGLR